MSGISTAPGEAARLYAERERRLYDTIALKPADRVPIIYYTMFYHATRTGRTIRDFMYDYDLLADVTKEIVSELQPDAVAPVHPLNSYGPTLDKIGYRQLQWPGHGVADNASYQYLDREYMKPEEYDDYLEDPTWFYLTRFMPRIAEVYAPFAKMPQFPAVQHLRLVTMVRYFGDPDFIAGVNRLVDAGQEAQRMVNRAAKFVEELAAMGYPIGQSASCPAPYDYFADYLRGSKGIMIDMYRRKDKLLAAMDRAIPMIIKGAANVALASPCKIVFCPMHWGLDGFMSLEQFKVFFWPQLRKVLMGLIDKGLVPLVLWEGDCTSRLETIADIPRGKAIYWFERTDLARAKEVLGDITCLRGNVPPSVLNTGTPDDVTECCRKLIKNAGKNGGFILDGAIGIPDEAKPENVAAMFRAAKEYGRY
jgi:uroporphyrinogen-III decarboxylase